MKATVIVGWAAGGVGEGVGGTGVAVGLGVEVAVGVVPPPLVGEGVAEQAAETKKTSAASSQPAMGLADGETGLKGCSNLAMPAEIGQAVAGGDLGDGAAAAGAGLAALAVHLEKVAHLIFNAVAQALLNRLGGGD